MYITHGSHYYCKMLPTVDIALLFIYFATLCQVLPRVCTSSNLETWYNDQYCPIGGRQNDRGFFPLTSNTGNVQVEQGRRGSFNGEKSTLQVNTWFINKEDILVTCSLKTIVDCNISEDKIYADFTSQWSFFRKKTGDKLEQLEKSSILHSDEEKCKIIRQFSTSIGIHHAGIKTSHSNRMIKQLKVECYSQLRISNIGYTNEGYYGCKAVLNITLSPTENGLKNREENFDVVKRVYYQKEILLSIKEHHSMSFIIISFLLVVVVAAFIIVLVGICYRLTWQIKGDSSVVRDTLGAEGGGGGWAIDASNAENMSHQYTMVDPSSSSSSGIQLSGLVFQANPESMTRLLECLDKLDITDEDNDRKIRSKMDVKSEQTDLAKNTNDMLRNKDTFEKAVHLIGNLENAKTAKYNKELKERRRASLNGPLTTTTTTTRSKSVSRRSSIIGMLPYTTGDFFPAEKRRECGSFKQHSKESKDPTEDSHWPSASKHHTMLTNDEFFKHNFRDDKLNSIEEFSSF